MNPSQQIIPGPRQAEMRHSGRFTSIELSHPGVDYAPKPDSEVRYFALLRRHRLAILLILGGAVLLSLVYTLVAHKVYQAKVILEVMGVNSDFMNGKDVDPTAMDVLPDAFIETQSKLLKSPPVVEKTIEQMTPSVPDNIAGRGLVGSVQKLFGHSVTISPAEKRYVVWKMLDNAKVKIEGTSNLISLTVDGPDPNLTSDTANGMTNAFIEAGEDARMNSASSTNKFLVVQLTDARKKLQDSENALQEYARQTGIVITSDTQESVATDKLRQIQSDLAKAQSDEAESRSQLDVSRTTSPDSLPQVLDDPTLQNEKARLADLRNQLADLSVTLTPANYKIQQLNAQIADLEQQYNRQRQNIIHRIEVQNSETARRKAILSASFNDQMGVVSDQSSKEVRYNILKREVDANRDIYQSMMQRVKEAQVIAALRASAVRVVSPATPPDLPSQPSLPIDLALGFLSGAALSVCYVMLRERSDESLRMPGESLRHMDVPELAVIPSAHLGRRERIPLAARNLQTPDALDGASGSRSAVLNKELVKWCQEETMMADAFRSAITSILLSRHNGISPRVILVTSPRPKAGKTTAVANLGISLAEIGRRVLVIDGDLRRPQLGKLFGLQFANGLSDILLDGGKGNTLDSLIRNSCVPGLYVLPGGSEPGNISKLLNSSQLDMLVENARSQFDFVLIDSPPMMGMADARLLSRNADGVILICRAGQTSAQQLADARRRLADDGTPVIGTILNDCDLRTEDPAYFSSYNDYARVSRD